MAQKSVGAKFSQQLKDLRSRINATAPHYIRCLKPNDELLPDEFDPKQIVEQLRYSGVLEAVRVSRAGYPTRYPHWQFMSRYYMLGDLGRDSSEKSKDITLVVKFIAKLVWEADIKRSRARDAVNQSQIMEQKVSLRLALILLFVLGIRNTHLAHFLLRHNTGIWHLPEDESLATSCGEEEEKENERTEQH